MKVLVTGGAGFIGSHSVEALLADGCQVVVLDNFSAGKSQNLPDDDRLKIVRGDIRDASAVDAALAGVSHVLHLAAQVSVRVSVEQPGLSCSHNILGFVTVCERARLAGVRRIVYASSAAVYGVPDRVPVDEDTPTLPISPYGLEKLADDQYASLFRRLHAMSLVGLRYFNVYGPRQDPTSQYTGVISKFTTRIAAGEPLTVFGDGLQTRDFVFVKDIARVNLAALRSDWNGVLNVGTGSSVTLLKLIDALAICASRRPEVRFEPALDGDVRHSAMSPRRLAEVLGCVPATPLPDGLRSLFG